MFLPTKGSILSDTTNMVDPHKIGRVMWARTEAGYMVPLDLHKSTTNSDKETLNRVYSQLSTFRKVRPAMEVVASSDWVDMAIVKPYLMASMDSRSEARVLMQDSSWEDFWSSCE